MSYLNSQEMTIYRSLAGQIQLGFYSDEEKFPTAYEIAQKYEVSYCPAQRALKALERDGLVELCRGKTTKVIAKPFDNFLDSNLFLNRAASLYDLCESLELISPAICFHGVCSFDDDYFKRFRSIAEQVKSSTGMQLYQMFELLLKALGSRTVLNLYYDINAFIQSAFLDILSYEMSAEKRSIFIYDIQAKMADCIMCFKEGEFDESKLQFIKLGKIFFQPLKQYLKRTDFRELDSKESFVWGPTKGRNRYCDIIAVDLICKINQGTYQVGELLPNGLVLSDIYHVSPMTIRRTVLLLNKLGIVKTINGVGTQVISKGDSSIPYKLKDFLLGDNLRICLENLQLLTITCEDVISKSFGFFTRKSLDSICTAISIEQQTKARISTISACMQAIIRSCPLDSIKEIYSKITLSLMKGDVLRLEETGNEMVPGWPELKCLFQKSLQKNDVDLFALTFRRLMEDCFSLTKESLLSIGIDDVNKIKTPQFAL